MAETQTETRAAQLERVAARFAGTPLDVKQCQVACVDAYKARQCAQDAVRDQARRVNAVRAEMEAKVRAEEEKLAQAQDRLVEATETLENIRYRVWRVQGIREVLDDLARES